MRKGLHHDSMSRNIGRGEESQVLDSLAPENGLKESSAIHTDVLFLQHQKIMCSGFCDIEETNSYIGL
jgi:hypothetical protein